MTKAAAALVVSEGQRQVLEALSVSRTAAHREVQQAQVLLLAAEGVANTRIASVVGGTAMTVRSWRTRFEGQGLTKFAKVAEGRGRKATIPQEVIDQIVDLTQNATPAGETHWSRRRTPHQSQGSMPEPRHKEAAGCRLPDPRTPCGKGAPPAEAPRADANPVRPTAVFHVAAALSVGTPPPISASSATMSVSTCPAYQARPPRIA